MKYIFAKNQKLKNRVFKIVDEIKQKDDDLNNIKVIWLLIKDVEPTDEDLINTCKVNHQDLDCENIKLLRQNNLLIKETKTLKEKSL
jgi:hypothetical protein